MSPSDESAGNIDSSSTAPGTHRGLGVPALRGSLWTMGGYATSQVLRLGSNLILTRLLFPAVFGELALVSIFIQGLVMFSDIGTGPAIVQSPRGEETRFLNTAWTIQSGRGVLLWLGSCAIAWPVAMFYERPMLCWLLPAAGLNAVLAGFEATAMHSLQRQLRLERLTILDLASQVVSILSTVALALIDRWVYGPNHPSAVWAVVGGGLLSSATRLALSHTYLPGIRNHFDLERTALTQLFGFGRWIFISTLLTFLALQSDRLIFGKMIPIGLFGVYSIAAMLASLPADAASKLGSAVIFPAYSRLAGGPAFAGAFARARMPVLLGGAAVVTALFACGPFVIGILYDERYAAAGWILQWLAAAAWFRMLEITNGAALLAQGRVRWLAAGNAAKVGGMALLIPLGFRLGGFPGALAGLLASDVLKYSTSCLGTSLRGLRGARQDLLFTIGIGAIGALALTAGWAVMQREWGNAVALLASGFVTGCAWGTVSFAQLRRWRRPEDLASHIVRST